MLQLLPLVAMEDCFALKGGTAINLFVRDMPRLSVDIDLTWLPISGRAESLAAIDAALRRIAKRIEERLRGATLSFSTMMPEKTATKVLVRQGNTQVEIEVTPVLRGCVFEPEQRTVSRVVEAAVSRSPTSTPGSSSPPWTGNTHAISLMFVISSRTKVLVMNLGRPSSSICSATTVPWLRSLPPAGNR